MTISAGQTTSIDAPLPVCDECGKYLLMPELRRNCDPARLPGYLFATHDRTVKTCSISCSRTHARRHWPGEHLSRAIEQRLRAYHIANVGGPLITVTPYEVLLGDGTQPDEQLLLYYSAQHGRMFGPLRDRIPSVKDTSGNAHRLSITYIADMPDFLQQRMVAFRDREYPDLFCYAPPSFRNRLGDLARRYLSDSQKRWGGDMS